MYAKSGHPRPAGGRFPKIRSNALIMCIFYFGLMLLAPRAWAIDAAIVIDANTDSVLTQQNPDRLLHPASMSKLMTLYLTFDALEAGKLTLQRTLPVSGHAESMSPTKLNLVAGQTIRVEDAILSLVTLSANDSAVVLAEALGGTEEHFGQLMTRKAHQLGMVNTNFRNSNGLPDPAQISTARDMAILCRALIRRFPQYYHYFSVREFTYNGIEHANHNHLMSRYEGMDGLKTGLTNASGFNLAASAVRNGRRLIGVVFGGTSAVQRDDYMASLLDQGFQRVGGVAMTTAAPPPVPGHKPAEAGGSPARVANAIPSTPTVNLPSPRLLEAALPNPIAVASVASGSADLDDRGAATRQTSIQAVSSNVGEGDVEGPGDARPARSPAKRSTATDIGAWSIQVGAYATRHATEQAIRQAVRKAPSILRHAIAVVSPLFQHHSTVYRARLAGLDAGEARKACRLLSHCLTVRPGAS